MNGGERSRGRATAASLIIALAPPAALRAGQQADLTTLSLEQLLQTKVISVSKQEETRLATPAAVHVVTGADVVQSGARTLPDALRLSPGVHVARNTASQWAIGIRGFTGTLARAQLALIDGRSVYTPLFAGTYWDVQDVLLDDLERIEVVRGPGGTLWGANAVNGIVNVISKSAADTQGGLVVLGAGNQERGFGRARYGGRWSGGAYRVYGLYHSRAPEQHPDGVDFDGWHMLRGGFRSDWTREPSQTLTVQGDVYTGRAGQRTTFARFDPPFVETVERDASLSGGNLRARWQRALTGTREIRIQVYYDRTHRGEAAFSETRDTYDLDAQYRFRLPGRHEVLAGIGYRLSDGRTRSLPALGFVPPERTDDLFSAFLEDTVELVPGRLQVAVGSKVERNDYSGFELQPSVRLGFETRPGQRLWAAVTRAVRTPTRFDRDLVFNTAFVAGTPAFARLLGDDGFETERSLVYETGYRARLSPRVALGLAAFHNRYPNLVSYEVGEPFLEPGRVVVPLRTANGTHGNVTGVEIDCDVRPLDGWLVRGTYSYLNMSVSPQVSSNDTGSGAVEDASPRHMASVASTLRLPGRVTLGAFYRWLARLPSRDIPAYSELDFHVAWRLSGRLELTAAGRNLLHPHHPEWSATVGELTDRDAGVRRSFHVQAAVTW